MNPEDIKQIRKKLGRTQASIAALVEATSMTWSRWETGASKPMPVYMRKLVKLKNHLIKTGVWV